MSSRISLFLAICLPLLASAQELKKIELPAHLKVEMQGQDNYRPSIIKSTELGWRESDIGADSLRVRVNFENVWQYGTKKKGFEEIQKSNRLFLKYYQGERIADFYFKVVSFKLESDQRNSLKAHLVKLERTLQTLKRRDSSLIRFVKMEDERKVVQSLLNESIENLQVLQESVASEFKLDMAQVKFSGLISLAQMSKLLKRIAEERRKTLTEKVLEQQLLVNQYDKDIRINAEEAILGHVEYQRRISDGDRAVDHAVTLGVTLPFLGDDTAKLMKMNDFTEKKFKLMKEIKDHRSEYHLLMSQTLRNIELLNSRNRGSRLELSKMKEQAIKNLALDEYSEVLSFEFKREQDHVVMLKEVYANFFSIAKESGEIFNYKNLLTNQL
jgi:hypothetical protein